MAKELITAIEMLHMPFEENLLLLKYLISTSVYICFKEEKHVLHFYILLINAGLKC